ncbi:MAG: efflux RND transporter permease subunit [Halanaerobium sp.]
MRKILKHNKLIVIIISLITLFFLFQLPKIEINNNIEVFLPDDHPTKMSNNQLDDIFGESDSIVTSVKFKEGEIFSPSNLKVLSELSSELENVSNIDEVTSLTNVDYIEGSSEGMVVEEPMKELPQNIEESRRIKNKLMNWDFYENNLYSNDFKSTQVLISLNEGLNNQEKEEAYYKIKEITESYKNNNMETYTAGATAVNVLMGNSMLEDIKYLIPFIIGVLILILYLFFKRSLAVVLILMTVLVSSIWSIGLMAYLGINLTLVSTVIPVLLIAVGSAYGIHILSHYYDYINEFQGEISVSEQRELVAKTVEKMGKAVFLAALTTVAGFGSLASSEIVPIKSFGIFTAIGIAAAFIVALFLIPSLLIIFANLKDNFKQKNTETPEFKLVLEKMHNFYSKRKITIIIIAVLILSGSLLGFENIIVDTPLIEMFKEDTEIRQADDFINDNFAGTNTMRVMVEGKEMGDLNHPDILTKMDSLQKHLTANFDEVGKASSITDYIKRMNQVMNYPEEEISEDSSEDSSEDKEISDSSETTSSFYEADKNDNSSSSDENSSEENTSNFYDDGSDQEEEENTSSFYQSDSEENGDSESGREILEGPDRDKNISEYQFIQLLNAAFSRAEKKDLNARELIDLLEKEMNYKAAAYYEIPSDLKKYNAASKKNLQNLVSQYLLLYSGSVDDLINDQLEPDKAQMLIQLNDPSNLVAEKVRKEIYDYSDDLPENYELTVSGNATMALEANNLIVSSQTRSIMISFIIVFLIVAISFRSIIAGIYGIIPLAFSLIINFGLMGHLGIKLDVGTSMVASIAIGIGVDYTIHFLHSYHAERLKDDDLYSVTQKTLTTTGKAIIFNAISVAAGFLVLLFSNFYPLIYLGFLIAVTMFTSSIASLTVLPLLLNMFKPKFIRKEY